MIAREFTGKGWTGEQYDSLIEKMNLDGHSAPGVLFHWAATTDDGVHAVDVYESHEAADRLVQDRVGPIVAELGLPAPQIREYAVRNLLTPR
jgi:hypothetical protein